MLYRSFWWNAVKTRMTKRKGVRFHGHRDHDPGRDHPADDRRCRSARARRRR
jgi:hypothetical protein